MQFTRAVFIIFSLIIFIQVGFGQTDNLPVLPKATANLQDFVPNGWKIANQLESDLDADGTIETVLVLQGANKEQIKEAEFLDYNLFAKDEKTDNLKFLADNNPVILAILSKEKESYKLIAQNNQILPLFVDSLYRWKHSVSLEEKTLKVVLFGKVSSGIRDNFGETTRIYKFQMRDSQLVLTEAEETFWFQAMLIRNGRKDRFQKYDFTKKEGFVVSTLSLDNQPAKEETRKSGTLIPFEKVSADSFSKIESLANIQPIENFSAPTFTSKEISQKVLQLIKSIKGIEEISPKNLEKIIGGKIVFDEENKNRYGYAGKIAGTNWFYQIFSLTESNGEKSQRLEFSFEKEDDKEDDLTPVCSVNYADYKKELTETGFTVKPFYGEHGRLLHWQFEKGNVEVNVKTYKYEKNECIKTIWINISM